jgi:3-phosphoshikimate 1-carboxyvinyltransferase
MNITIIPRPLKGEVAIVPSKSVSHRNIIAASLASGTSTVRGVLDSDDITATKEALSALGVRFDGDNIIANGLDVKRERIDCHESGSTLRFMIPVAMLTGKRIVFEGRNRLVKRPLDVFEDMFKTSDVTFERLSEDWLPVSVKGPLKPGEYVMRGDVSSQFTSGMLFALPLLQGDSSIRLSSPLESAGYVDLTIQAMSRFGVFVTKTDDGWDIKGSQRYIPADVRTEGDFSQAAFCMVAGTIGERLTLTNLDPDSIQGDKAVIDIINSMGGKIVFDPGLDAYVARPARTHAVTIDLSDIPDLGPVLMVLAALSQGTTRFTNAGRLRLKESDRIMAMKDMLETFGVMVEEDPDGVRVTGLRRFKGDVTINGYNDHRIVMAAAVAAIRADGPVTITDAQAVNKSWPSFFETYASLGGEYDEGN